MWKKKSIGQNPIHFHIKTLNELEIYEDSFNLPKKESTKIP